MAGAMDARGVVFGRLFVAGGTVHRLGRDVIVRVFRADIGVTSGASIRVVNRMRQLGLVNVKRDADASGIGFIERFVGVAIQAG